VRPCPLLMILERLHPGAVQFGSKCSRAHGEICNMGVPAPHLDIHLYRKVLSMVFQLFLQVFGFYATPYLWLTEYFDGKTSRRLHIKCIAMGALRRFYIITIYL